MVGGWGHAQGVGRDLKKKFHDAAAGAVHVGESVTINQGGNGRGLGRYSRISQK